MKSNIYVTATEVMHAVINSLIDNMRREPERVFHIAFSGGSTSVLLFGVWAKYYAGSTPWERMRFYWVDECCVPSGDSESNYGVMQELLLSEVGVAGEQVFPIFCDRQAVAEAERYSEALHALLPRRGGVPSFDVVLQECGADGHIASIFPGQEELLVSPSLYAASIDPYSGQERITMAGNLLYNADRLVFLLVGAEKAGVVRDLLGFGDTSPAAYVAHHADNAELFMDRQAAGG